MTHDPIPCKYYHKNFKRVTLCNGVLEQVGYDVAASGNTVIAGAPLNDDPSGAAYVFDITLIADDNVVAVEKLVCRKLWALKQETFFIVH